MQNKNRSDKNKASKFIMLIGYMQENNKDLERAGYNPTSKIENDGGTC
jgi:hypothetical protein